MGKIIRNVTPEETKILSELHARRPRIEHNGIVYGFDVGEQNARGEQTKTPRKFVKEGAEVYDIKTTRDLICLQLYSMHGPFQLRYSSGQIIKTFRLAEDRVLHRDSANRAPEPDHCICSDYEGREPGKHHWTCPHNLLAPYEQQGVNPDQDHGETTAEQFAAMFPEAKDAEGKPTHYAPPPQVAAPNLPPTQPPPPAPDDCTCRDYAGTEPGKHHRVCWAREAWEALEAAKPQSDPEPAVEPPPESEPKITDAEVTMVEQSTEPVESVLVDDGPDTDLEPTPMILMTTSGKFLREATQEEIEESQEAQRETGMPMIHVAGTPYAVVPRERA